MGNHRNGVSAKTVLTDDGSMCLEVPCDRDGSFDPLLIPKHESRFSSFDDKIVATQARCMTVHEIQVYKHSTSQFEASTMTDQLRRKVIRGGLWGAPLLASSVVVQAQPQPATEGRLAWMQAFRSVADDGSRAVIGRMRLQWFPDPIWALTEPIVWIPNTAARTDQKAVTVPRGFVTDLTSVPPVFFSLLRPEGPYAYAAVVHDYLYWFQQRSRLESDEILRLVMDEFPVAAADKWAIYAGVRAGGGVAWKANADLKAAGEKRVLKRFPDNPTVKWASWKLKPGVFVK